MNLEQRPMVDRFGSDTGNWLLEHCKQLGINTTADIAAHTARELQQMLDLSDQFALRFHAWAVSIESGGKVDTQGGRYISNRSQQGGGAVIGGRVNTGGGSYHEGDFNTGGSDFVGRSRRRF